MEDLWWLLLMLIFSDFHIAVVFLLTEFSSQKSFEQLSKGALRKKRPYSELFWSVFSRIRTEYGEIRTFSPYSVRMRENADRNNSEYGHFSRSGALKSSAFKNVQKFIKK